MKPIISVLNLLVPDDNSEPLFLPFIDIDIGQNPLIKIKEYDVTNFARIFSIHPWIVYSTKRGYHLVSFQPIDHANLSLIYWKALTIGMDIMQLANWERNGITGIRITRKYIGSDYHLLASDFTNSVVYSNKHYQIFKKLFPKLPEEKTLQEEYNITPMDGSIVAEGYYQTS